jgi:hypothetical protein
MQSQVVAFVTKAIECLGKWVWHDPIRSFDLIDELPDTGFEIPLKFGPKDRKESEFIEMNFQISPASMRQMNSEQRLAILSNTVSSFLVPLAPQLQTQGMAIDAAAFIRQVADLTSMPEIETLLMPMGAAGEAGILLQQGKPDETTRNYVRENISTGGTQESRDAATIQSLMGNSPAPGQEQMMNQPSARPTMA